MSPRDAQAGVTLIEMLVSLALFALIATAGFAVLDQVLRSQRAAEARLERLSALQRALHLVQSDAMMARPGSLRATPGTLDFDRSGGLGLRYGLVEGTLQREITREGRSEAAQAVLGGVKRLTWRFLDAGGQWSESWPPDPGQAGARNPRAIEWLILLQDRGLTLRRVTALPADLAPGAP